MSHNALKVLNRLNHSGFDAYLVGGGVRDLLLRHNPKDFDVATNAHPQKVRKLFRNCRLIGRRFRLAHILFGREVIEVATFRGKAKPKRKAGSGMIIRDNTYGNIVTDSWRRDFTINALYYNIADYTIVDITGGFEDIQNKLIRIIGDPDNRYREDPVRMLRAVRFAAKLDFDIEEKTQAPIKTLSHLISEVPTSRLFDEILKLYHSGYALKIHEKLKSFDLYAALFPQARTFDDALLKACLQNTDQRISQNQPVTPAFLFAVLLWLPLQDEIQRLKKTGMLPLTAIEKGMRKVIANQSKLSTIPKRFGIVMREIWLLQHRFTRRTGSRPYKLLRHPRFRAAYDFLVLRAQIGEVDKALADWWTTFQAAEEDEQERMLDALKGQQSS